MSRAAPYLVAAVAAVYFGAFVHYGILLEDEGLLLLQIARAFHGEFPYVDFHTGYSPSTFYLNAALFRLFGESVIPIRVFLALVNATTVGLLFALARPWAGTALAAVTALGWAAHLPVFVGIFCSFNVPYPSWYADCGFLATQLAFDRHLATRRRMPLVAAGVAAGITFGLKQNAGALAVLACGLTLALLRAGRDDRDRHLARALLVAGALFLLSGFTVAITSTEAAFVIGPALLLIAGRLGFAREPGPPTERLAPAVTIMALGMIVVTLPWLVPFLMVLGLRGLLREIFLVGTEFDLVYSTPYPLPIGLPDVWPLVATLGLAAVTLSGIAVRRRRMRVRTAVVGLAVAGAAAVVAIVHFARMPEGLLRAIMLQSQSVGFYAAPLLFVAVSVEWLRCMRRPGGSARPFEPRLLAVLVFACCMYAELYPRIDSTHLLVALPSGLVLAAWTAARVTDAWATALGVRRRLLRQAVIAAAATLALIAAVPNFSAFVGWRDGALAWHDRVAVASPTAPVHVDAEHGSDVQALNALLAYLREHLGPGEGIFGFPAVGLVSYLLGHPFVTGHAYWYAGRPDHLEEAQVVRTLERDIPRYVITVNRNIGFFSNSARYYFILRAFVQAHYVLVARFGRYDVLARRELATGPPVVEDYTLAVDARLISSLADPLHEPRRAVVREFLARAETPEGVVRLADVIAPDPVSRLLLLRAFSETPDVRTLPLLARTFDETNDRRVQREAAFALTYLALHAAEHRYLLGRRPDEPEPSLDDLAPLIDAATVRRWLAARDARESVGAFAIWFVAGTRDREAMPFLEATYRLEERSPYLRMLAANTLVRAGRLEYLCELVSLLGDKRHDYQDGVPSMVIEAAAEHPNEVALCLSQGMLDSRRRGREVSAWTAGAAGLRATAPALRNALADPEPRVRAAATWALGRIGDAEARPDLARLARDDDSGMRAFAAEALARLDQRSQ